jgi:hypothetical protein
VVALKDATVYAIIRWKYLNKTVIAEDEFKKLEDEGWKPVEGKVGTTFPQGEDWRWKAYKKSIEKGDVDLDLKTLKWDKQAVIFIFK